VSEQRYAILIGNGQYDPHEPKLPALRCPPQDVAGLKEILSSDIHGPYRVTDLVDQPSTAIKEAIYDVLLNQAGKDDIVLLYYSGHGKPDQHGDLHLASSDTRTKFLPITSVPVGTLGQWMRQSRCSRIVLILDCCYSGAVERIFTRGEVSDQVAQALPKQVSGRGTYILTASTDVEMAEEKETDQNGLLTKHIIAGIRDGGADRDDDGQVSMNELLAYVQEKVAAEGAQTPLGFSFSTEGGELVLARTGKEARQQRVTQVRQAIHQLAATQHIPSRIVWTILEAIEPSSNHSLARQGRIDRLYRKHGDAQALATEMYDIARELDNAAQNPPLPLPATPAPAPTLVPITALPPKSEEPPSSGEKPFHVSPVLVSALSVAAVLILLVIKGVFPWSTPTPVIALRPEVTIEKALGINIATLLALPGKDEFIVVPTEMTYGRPFSLARVTASGVVKWSVAEGFYQGVRLDSPSRLLALSEGKAPTVFDLDTGRVIPSTIPAPQPAAPQESGDSTPAVPGPGLPSAMDVVKKRYGRLSEFKALPDGDYVVLLELAPGKKRAFSLARVSPQGKPQWSVTGPYTEFRVESNLVVATTSDGAGVAIDLVTGNLTGQSVKPGRGGTGR